jgi:hypothetical protein
MPRKQRGRQAWQETVRPRRLIRVENKSGQRGRYREASPRRPGTAPALGLRAGNDVQPLYRRPVLERRNIMSFLSWLRNRSRPASVARRHKPVGFRPRLETFEDRCVPAGLPYPTAANVSQIIADINYADQAGGTFTMNLKPGVTFDLKSVNNTTDGPNGLPVIGGAKAVDLTILGNGDSIRRLLTTGRGGKYTPSFRLFDVAPGASLTLDHVNVTGGSGTGGAVYNQGSVTVRYSTLWSTAFYNAGDDLYNAGGTVTFNNSTAGAGIDNVNGTATLSYSTLSRYVSNSGGTVTINHSTGSGFSNMSGAMTISDCTVSGGNGVYGGGIFNMGTMTVSNCTISGNTAYYYGGGIYNAGTMTVSNCTISGNTAYYYGGGIYNSGTLTLDSTTVSGNQAIHDYDREDGGYVGGLFNAAGGTVIVKNHSSIIGNFAEYSPSGSDVWNEGVLYLDSSSVIGLLDGHPPIPI